MSSRRTVLFPRCRITARSYFPKTFIYRITADRRIAFWLNASLSRCHSSAFSRWSRRLPNIMEVRSGSGSSPIPAAPRHRLLCGVKGLRQDLVDLREQGDHLRIEARTAPGAPRRSERQREWLRQAAGDAAGRSTSLYHREADIVAAGVHDRRPVRECLRVRPCRAAGGIRSCVRHPRGGPADEVVRYYV